MTTALSTVPANGAGVMSMQVFDAMCDQASALISSGFLPAHIRTPEQAVAIRLMGEELGVPMMLALRKIHVIQGTPACASELLLALARRTGELEDMQLKDDGQCCTCTIKRRGQTAHTTTFSMADAQAMGLAGKDNWKKQAPVMRQWRALAKNLRVTFADAIGGMYPLEEIAPDVEVDATGNAVPAATIPGQPIQRSKAKSKQIENPPPASAEGAAQPPARQEPAPAPAVAAQPSAAPASSPKPDPTPASSASSHSSTQPAQTAAPSKSEARVGVVEMSKGEWQPPTPAPTQENPSPAKPPKKTFHKFKVTLGGEMVEMSSWESEVTKVLQAAMEASLFCDVTFSTNAKGQRRCLTAKAVEPGPAPTEEEPG